MTHVLRKLIIQFERMLDAMADGGFAIALETMQVTSGGSRDDRIELLRLAAFESSGALKYESARLATDSPDNSLKAHESR